MKTKKTAPKVPKMSTSMAVIGLQQGEIYDLKKELKKTKEELEITNRLLEERTRLLKAIPPCEAHGEGCVPHAIEWVEKVKTLALVITAPIKALERNK